MTPNSSFCAMLWPKESAGKSFSATRETKKAAEQSAAEEFWKDRDVKKIASNLPPSKRKKDRYNAQEEFLHRLELKRNARLAEKSEQAKQMKFRKQGQ